MGDAADVSEQEMDNIELDKVLEQHCTGAPMSHEDSTRTIKLVLTETQHRLLCRAVRHASHDKFFGEECVNLQQLYQDIIVNGPAFHTTPELCTHPIEFLRCTRRWPTLDQDDVGNFYAEYLCDVCGSKRTDVEDEDGGTLQEGEWEG